MPKPSIITGQSIDAKRIERAKELRQEMTDAEKYLWQNLKGNRLDGRHFRRQQIIAGFIVDFYCHQSNLVIEVDGSSHDGQEQYDDERERVLLSWGLKVIRFTNDQVLNHLPEVLKIIRRNL